MKIYIINLDRARDRMDNMYQQLLNLNLSCQRVSAIDGSTMEINGSIIDQSNFKLSQGRECSLGELGCALSHRLVWERIISSSETYSLILEDDVILPSNLASIIQEIQKESYFDIINLSSSGTYPLTNQKIQYLRGIGLITRPLLKGRNHWRRIEAGRWKIFSLRHFKEMTLCECSILPPLTSGYVVTKRACIELLKASDRLSFPIDYTFRFVGGYIRQAFSFPSCIPQKIDVQSSIGDRSTELQLNFKNYLIRKALKKRNLRRRLNLLRMYGIKNF